MRLALRTLILALAALGAADAYAGERVLVRLVDGATHIGDVVQRDPDALYLQLADGTVLQIALDAVASESPVMAAGSQGESEAPAPSRTQMPPPKPANPHGAAEPDMGRTGTRAFSMGFNLALGTALYSSGPQGVVDFTGDFFAFEARFFLPNDKLSFDVQIDPLGSAVSGLLGSPWFGADGYVHPRIAQGDLAAFTIAPGIGLYGGAVNGIGAFRADFNVRIGGDFNGRDRKFEAGLYLRAKNGVFTTPLGAAWISEVCIEATFMWNKLRKQ